jgi:transcriptional antiterminator NusG
VSESKPQDELGSEPQETPADSAVVAEQAEVENAATAEELTTAEEPAADAAEEPAAEAAADEPVQAASAEEDSTAGAESPDEPATEAETVEEVAEAAEPVAAEEAAAEDAGAEEAAAGQNGRQIGIPGMDWYIIHTYSGFENKVKESLRSRADAFGFGERIGEILIPTEDVVEMRSGKKVTSKRMLYPGYVLVQLEMDDELWHVVKNTPRVTGFVGGGQAPTPLTADEVNQTLYRQKSSAEKPRPKMTFEKNDRVKIVDVPFANFTGSVEEVNEDRNTVKVMVTIFGRGTPVELEYFQVEKEDG